MFNCQKLSKIVCLVITKRLLQNVPFHIFMSLNDLSQCIWTFIAIAAVYIHHIYHYCWNRAMLRICHKNMYNQLVTGSDTHDSWESDYVLPFCWVASFLSEFCLDFGVDCLQIFQSTKNYGPNTVREGCNKKTEKCGL